MLEKTNILNTLIQKMSWQVARGEQFNKNMANIETPGFKRLDIEPFDVYLNPNKSTTSYRTIQSSQELSREKEMISLTENATDYQSNLQLFRKYMNLMKIIIGSKGQ